jgi:3-hydroxyethyl bacteriochlorophyllide a dehydrogenase
MPPFPGMGYPLVPGYESVGRGLRPATRAVAGRRAGVRARRALLRRGHGLFGGAASRVVVPGARLLPVPDGLGEQGVLLALAATASTPSPASRRSAAGADHRPRRARSAAGAGRHRRRCAAAGGLGDQPAARRRRQGYDVIDPATDDERHDYGAICDVSGDASLLDS